MANRTQGLLSNPMFMAGMGLLGSNSWGGGLQGLLAANQSRMADQQWQVEEADRQMRQQVQQMQLAQAQRQEAARAALTSAMQSGDTQGALAALAELSPETLAGKMFAQNKPVSVAPGATLVDPQTGKPVFTAPPDPNALTYEQKMALALARGGQSQSPMNVREYEYFMNLPPEQRQQYLTVKRAQQWQDTGAEIVAPNMADIAGAPAVVLPKSLPPQDRPEVKGAQAAATVAGESAAKRQATMTGINSILDEAEKILVKGNPTASGMGRGVDAVTGFVGITPGGAAEADQLDAIGGALVAKMPRMEGPQSNYDVENYKIMAGNIGNRSLPVKRRLAALQAVRQLWAKYEHLNRDAPAEEPPPGSLPDGWAVRQK